jgi:hypothetical protein
MTPLRPPQRIQLCKLGSKSHGLSGVNVTAQAIWHRSGRWPRIQEALAAFKGNIYKKLHRQIVLPSSYNNHKKYMGYLRIVFGLGGVIDTAKAKIGDFKVEYLREFQAICKKTLTCIRCLGKVVLWKKPDVENLVTSVPSRKGWKDSPIGNTKRIIVKSVKPIFNILDAKFPEDQSIKFLNGWYTKERVRENSSDFFREYLLSTCLFFRRFTRQ